MLKPVAFYDAAIADLMAAAGRQFVTCLPHYDSVDSRVCRWQPQPEPPRFRGLDLALGNFVAARLGDSDAYLGVLLALLRFLMCGIEEDAGVTLSAGEVVKMLASEPFCNQARRVPFHTQRQRDALRFGKPPLTGDFLHLVVQVSLRPFAKGRLIVGLHGPQLADPASLLGFWYDRTSSYVTVAESFTPMPDGIDIVHPTAQLLEVPNDHMTPSSLDLDFELQVCTTRLQGGADRIARTVRTGITYTCVTTPETIGRGPVLGQFLHWPDSPKGRFRLPPPPRTPPPDDEDDPDDH
jgi:hypothetical protein